MHQSFLVHVPDDVTIDAVDPVPLGHKVALRDIAEGEQIIK